MPGLRFHETAVPGVLLVEPEPYIDDRGTFVRLVASEEFRSMGLAPSFEHVNVTWNERAGTLRGLHLQAPPYAEAKLVRCLRGSLFDVAVDLRDGSPTRGRHVSATLTADNGVMLYLPAGCAHGYQALEDGTQVLHFHSVPYAPHSERGFRWDDPAFGIPWPIRPPILSEKDSRQPILAG